MPDPIPPEALHAAAEAVRDARCGHAAGRWACFSCRAEAAVEAAAPLLAAQAVAKERQAVAAYLRRAHKGHGFMKLETFGRLLAGRVEAGEHIPLPCNCETLHNHCYASGCPCKRHEREAGSV